MDIYWCTTQSFKPLFIIIIIIIINNNNNNTPAHITFASATFAQPHLPIPDLLPLLNLEI